VVSSGYDLQDHIMVSPPLGFMSFDDVLSMPSTGLIVTGANDDVAPSGLVSSAIQRWQINPQFEVIEECDHFYTACLNKLNRVLSDYLI
jgi:alpha/beta superfamily hydrolase